MVGYRLKNTVTEFGSVARGVCEIEDGMLTGVTERTKIFKRARTPNTPRMGSISFRWRATPSYR